MMVCFFFLVVVSVDGRKNRRQWVSLVGLRQDNDNDNGNAMTSDGTDGNGELGTGRDAGTGTSQGSRRLSPNLKASHRSSFGWR